jgi:uncharacterized repeat protein (TIGR04042 family)
MPAMQFRVRWPDGSEDDCYSPSLIIKDYLAPGESYAVEDFMARMRTALAIASERVRQKFGFACSAAADQLQTLEDRALRFPETGAQVSVIDFSDAR